MPSSDKRVGNERRSFVFHPDYDDHDSPGGEDDRRVLLDRRRQNIDARLTEVVRASRLLALIVWDKPGGGRTDFETKVVNDWYAALPKDYLSRCGLAIAMPF